MILEVLPAKAGDCLILHCGDVEDPRLILIDGGPAGVWQSTLKDRLLEIRDERELSGDDALVIDLVVVSHVDDDHINGIIRLLEFIKDRTDNALPPLFQIKRLWHNSFDNILGNDETLAVLKSSQFGAASTATDIEALLEDLENDQSHDTAFVLASISQGDDLRRLAGALNIPINPDFGGSLVQVSKGLPISINVGGVDLHIAGPLHDELVDLQVAHDKWLKAHPERRDDPTAILAALQDKSVANLSSIVLLAEHEGKTLLLTGDARGDKVLSGLEAAGLLAPGSTLPLDILKMPHHGSIRNIDDVFLERLPAKHYVFCGNGKHGNPDRETFDLLFDRRSGASMAFVLSDPIPEIDLVRKAEHEKEMAKRMAKQKEPGRPWIEARDSLAALLAPPPIAVSIAEPQQDNPNLIRP